ncbi:MAG: methylenetetrahydrofolate--tRNA-(uracil(54)-C(5))-methyltransferase (FADH(2)-oxidizing) TrmFO [Armatimonadetes bacterium]|nr:methylenetetrahydrofolate--tRNA-(uracil(54)-C(5))-methyltransferase (FADH(2)-oxidizing) TrmFO [Armatimonadota bacterium]
MLTPAFYPIGQPLQTSRLLNVITVVGGGFAGVEAAWAVAQRGAKVRLYEMRPVRMTPAHQTDALAELVCSNSFKSNSPDSPAGLLKQEMIALGSVVIPAALDHRVPGGEALAVDRVNFAAAVTAQIDGHPNIEVVRQPFEPNDIEAALAQGPVILATGPLTTPEIAKWLSAVTGSERLYFYDAVSPVVTAESLDRSIIFAQSRYDKGEGDDYLNCPFNKEEYEAFVRELVSAERAPIHNFEAEGETDLVEKAKYFAGCMPIEVIAERGARSLAFGNFKPVGLTDPRTGRRPWAALQLRPENREKTLYSLVACQTRLKWGEQKRVFNMVPGLANADFVRLGVIHRNTYVEAPKVLKPNLELDALDGLFLAGQITGVEGYLESAAVGILAGIWALAKERGEQPVQPPRETALGSLLSHLQDQTEREFAPMNINWGLLPDPEEPTRDKGVKKQRKLEAARKAFEIWMFSNLTP